MNKIRGQILLDSLKFYDLFAAVGCFLLATAMVSHEIPEISFRDFLTIRVRLSNFVLMGLFAVAWHYILVGCGLYTSKRLSSFQGEVVDIFKATSLGTALLLLLSVIAPISMVDNQFLIVFLASVIAVMLVGRGLMRLLLPRARLRETNLREVVIVGMNDRAFQLARGIEANPGLGYRIRGFVDDRTGDDHGIDNSGYKWLGSLDGIRSVLAQQPVDEVIICLPLNSFYKDIAHIVALCEQQGIIVRLRPDLFNLAIGRSQMDYLDGLSVVTITTGVLDDRAAAVKRLIDILGSGILLTLLSPVMLATALLVKVTSRGPVLFVQDRLGRNKRLFRIYKFRTMVQGADRMLQDLEHLNEADGAAFKIRDDPRFTPVGRFLRKTSIDELPQLFNVLKGDMSLVGPRPMQVRDYNHFSEDWHRRRFSVKPGITCLWQVSGRSDIGFHQWMELDMSYIDHWSLWLDVKILLRTVSAVLQRRGAS
jgi:exopolysaccharide biosynthesis polyprenyl glycosylphosphotransferase